MHSTSSIIRFVLILTSLVALILSFLNTGLKAKHEANEALYAKKAILSAVSNKLDNDIKKMSDNTIEEIFANQITQTVVNVEGETLSPAQVVESGEYKNGKAEDVDLGKERRKPVQDRFLPVFEYTAKDGKKYYIVSVRGNGLWDEIWGNIALEDDLNTIAGVSFDHKAETPGLGAEIKDNKGFPAQFVGKKIYDDNGNYKSVTVRKGGAKDPYFEVDGISGATITCDGVTDMLVEGLKYYEPYFSELKSNS